MRLETVIVLTEQEAENLRAKGTVGVPKPGDLFLPNEIRIDG